VVFAGGTETGIIVDEVIDVLTLSADTIEDAPSFGAAADTRSIAGIGNLGDKVIILLDVDEVVADDEPAADAPTAQAASKQTSPPRAMADR
jgi:purine-binding chemotaxis protein CheW